MDEIADYNVGRRRAPAEGGALYARPLLDPAAAPGEWDHFLTVVRPWLTFLSRYEPPAPVL